MHKQSLVQFNIFNSVMIFLILPCAGALTHSMDEMKFVEALRVNPADAVTRAAYGRWLHSVGKEQEAEVEARSAVNQSPKDPSLRRDLAMLLAATGDVEAAEQEFATALELEPTCSQLRVSYARFLHEEKRDMVRAEKQYEAAADAVLYEKPGKEKADVHIQYARFLEGCRADLGKTEKQYERAAEVHPSASTLTHYAGFLRHQRRDYRAAESRYQEALEHEPDAPDALVGYGTFLEVIRKDYPRAEEMYRKAVENSWDARSRHIYARFLKSQQDYVRMAKIARQAVELDSELEETWWSVLAYDPAPTSVSECARISMDAANLIACVLLLFVEKLVN